MRLLVNLQITESFGMILCACFLCLLFLTIVTVLLYDYRYNEL